MTVSASLAIPAGLLFLLVLSSSLQAIRQVCLFITLFSLAKIGVVLAIR